MTMTAKEEAAYEMGDRRAWLSLLAECLRRLGYEPSEAAAARWVLEREAAVLALRSLCAGHGDNDWPVDLHLADVIDKHLARHLEARTP